VIENTYTVLGKSSTNSYQQGIEAKRKTYRLVGTQDCKGQGTDRGEKNSK
jgi:hypothetical protein